MSSPRTHPHNNNTIVQRTHGRPQRRKSPCRSILHEDSFGGESNTRSASEDDWRGREEGSDSAQSCSLYNILLLQEQKLHYRHACGTLGTRSRTQTMHHRPSHLRLQGERGGGGYWVFGGWFVGGAGVCTFRILLFC